MPRTSARGPLALLGLLSDDPVTTAELYERAGYPLLLRAGLIPYAAFKRALSELVSEGLAASQTDDDGATLWWRTAEGERVVRRRA